MQGQLNLREQIVLKNQVLLDDLMHRIYML